MASLAETSGSSGVASSSGARLQQKYDELDSMFPSQLQPCTSSQGTPNAEAGQEAFRSVHELQNQIGKLCSKHIFYEQKRVDIHQQLIELKERREQQQQTLLSYQMHLEQLSNQLQAEISSRETLQMKVQHSSQVGVSLQHHCKSINDTLLQMSQVKDDLSNHVNHCIESYANVKEEATRLQNNNFQEMRNLMFAIREEKLKQHQIYAAYVENLNYETSCHQKKMVQLKQEISKMQLQVEDKNLQLASSKETVGKIKKNHGEMSQKLNEDKCNLQIRVNILEKSYEKSKTTLTQASEEKACLTAKASEISQEIEKLTDRISTSEKHRNECLKRKEKFIQNTLETQCKKKEVARDLEKVCLHNKELKVKINDLREQKEVTSIDGKCKISKIEESLDSYKAETSTRTAKLEQEISSARQVIDTKQKKCEDLQELNDIEKKKLQKIEEDHEFVKSSNSSMESQLDGKKSIVQNLSCELQELAARVKIEEENELQLNESLQQQKHAAEKELKTLFDKIEDAKHKLSIAREAVPKKSSDVTVLAQSLEQVERDSKVSEMSTSEESAATIKELETKLENLVQRKEQMIQESQTMCREWQEKLNLQNKLMANKENEIIECRRISEEIQKNSVSQKNNERVLQNEIEDKIKCGEELKHTVKILEEGVLKMSRMVDGLELTRQEKETILKAKFDELNELKHKIKELQDTQANTLAKSCEEKKELEEKLATTKQNCESLSSNISHLKAEIDNLQKTFALLQKKKAASLKSGKDLENETNRWTSQTEKKKLELEKLKTDFEKGQKKIKCWKRDAMAYKREHQQLVTAINTAKAKKRQDAKANSSSSMKETKTPIELSEVKNTTPRSILKPSDKPPTPQNVKKCVSFNAHHDDDDDDLPSTSSTIVLEDDMVDAIEKNPAVIGSIISKKLAEKAGKKTD